MSDRKFFRKTNERVKPQSTITKKFEANLYQESIIIEKKIL